MSLRYGKMAGKARRLSAGPAAMLVAAVLLGAGSASAMRIATNGILTVKMNDDQSPSGGVGLFTVETGAGHPNPGKSVFYNSAADLIGTSYVTLIDLDNKGIWINAEIARTKGMTPAEGGYMLNCMVVQPTSITDIGSPARGFTTTYTLPGWTLTQEVEIMGSTLFNSSVRQTVKVRNTSGATAHFGLRYLWDWMVNAVDASYFRTLGEPPSPYGNTFQAFSSPSFPRYEASDSNIIPTFSIFGTCTGGSLLYPPTQPDELRYASWSDASKHPWGFTVTGSALDSGIVYYWGLGSGITIGDGEELTYTQYVTTSLGALLRGVPKPSLAVSNSGDACSGETLTWTIGFENVGDATTFGVTFRDTLPVGTEYVPGSLEFWAASDPAGGPSLAGSGYAGGPGGPWAPGEPPGAFGPPQFLMWVVDRIVPGGSGFIRFQANVARGLGDGTSLAAKVSATRLWEDGVLWTPEAKATVASLKLWKYSLPTKYPVDAWEPLDYLLLLQSPCNTTQYDISVFDSLPPGMQYPVPLTGNGTLSGTVMVTWSVPSLAPGASAYLTYQMTPDGKLDLVCNQAQADYSAYRGATLEPQRRLSSNFECLDVNPAQLYFRKMFDEPPPQRPAARDGTVNFVIEILNLANATLTNVTMWDSLPGGMGYLSDDKGGNLSGTTMVWWNVPDVHPGDDWAIRLQVQLYGTCEDIGPQSAVLVYDPVPGVPPAPLFTNEAWVPLIKPELLMAKTINPNPVLPGEEFTYEIAIVNAGGVTAVNIVVWDSVPEETTFVSASPGGTLFSGPPDVVGWYIVSLPPGAWSFVSYVVQIDTWAASVGVTSALARYTDDLACASFSATSWNGAFAAKFSLGQLWGEEGGWGLPPALSYTDVVSIAQPCFDLSKYADRALVPPGTPVVWTLSVTNTGTDSALNVVVRDPLPGGVTYVSCTAPPGWTCSLSGSEVLWTGPELPVGASAGMSFTTVILGPGDGICNTPFVRGENRVGARTPQSGGLGTCVGIGEAFVGVTKLPSTDPAYQDSKLTYWFSLSNTGKLAAQGVTLWDTLPSGGDYDSCGGGTSCGRVGNLVYWQVPDLNPNDVAQMWVTVIARNAMSCTNYGEVDYANSLGTTRPRATSNGVCVPVVDPCLTGDVRPTKALYANGEPVTYLCSWTNTCTGAANKVGLACYLPGTVTFQTASMSSSGDPYSLIWNGSEWTVNWDLGSVAAGASGWATLTVLPKTPLADVCESGDFPINAVLKYEAGQGDWRFPPVTIRFATVWDTVLSLSLTANGFIVAQGTPVTFTLTLQNSCDQTIVNISVWDSLPPGLDFVAASLGGTKGAGPITWSLPPIRPYQSLTLTFTATAIGEGPWIGPQVSEADFANSAGLAEPTAISNPVTIGVLAPLLDTRKTAPGEGPSAAPVVFTLTVRNTGTDTAYGVVLIDSLPVPLRPVAASPTAYLTSRMAAWDVGTLAPGASFAATLTASAPDPQQDYQLTNTAVARYTTASGYRKPDRSGSALVVLTGTLVLRVYPNPFDPARAVRGTMKFTGLPAGSRVLLFTLTGAEMRVLEGVARHTLEWDGRNRDGAPVAAGIYLYVVEIPDGKGGVSRLKGKVGVVR